MKKKFHFHVYSFSNYVIIKKYVADSVKCSSDAHLVLLDRDEKNLQMILEMHEVPKAHYSLGIFQGQPTALQNLLLGEYLAANAPRGEQPLLNVSGQFNGRKRRLAAATREQLEIPAMLILMWLRSSATTLVLAPHLWVLTVIQNLKVILKMIKEKDECFSISSEKHE